VLLSHSKNLSQQLHHLAASFSQLPIINLFMGELGEVSDKHIIIGSPLQVNNLWKKEKDRIVGIIIP